jgi:hypothetical protein
MESWVDDLTSVIQGSEQSCVRVGVDAGLFIAAGAKRLGLKISPKSAVLFNRPGVAKQVAEQLREHGIIIQATDLTKDLGLGTTAAGKRRTTHQYQRRQKMSKRLVRIQGLVKQDRRCRAMVWVAAKPQGTWGHQANGLAPTTVRKLRQQFAGAAMLRRTGGCTTTAFGLTVGLSKDPTIGLRMELFGSWLEVAVNPSIPKLGLERVWGQLRDSLAGPRRWHQVRGPMGAVVATLRDLGWKPDSPTQWTDPDGHHWDIDPGAPGVAVQLKALVAEFIEKDLWRQAGKHEGGRGLENGADLTVARRMRRKFLKQGELKKVGVLELICQGAGWPPARKAAAGLPVDPICTFCRKAPGTIKHQTWECTGLLKAIGEDRAEGLELEATALRADWADERPSWQVGRPPPANEAFWSRGIPPPPQTLNLLQPPEHRIEWIGELVKDGTLMIDTHGSSKSEPLFAGSDGSGGKHGTDPRLRRVGWSWAVLQANGRILAGASGGLTGKAQTVPRAELFAAVHFLEHVVGHATLYIDNKFVVDGIAKVRGGWRAGPKTEHGDLWGRIAAQADSRLKMVSTVKIKSHLKKDQAEAAGVPALAWEANFAADLLADQAAERHQFADADVEVVGRIDTTTEIVLRRLVSVASHILEAQLPVVRAPVATLLPLRAQLSKAGAENGHEIFYEAGVGCRRCRKHTRLRLALAWMRAKCPGPGVDHGHCMQTVHGLTFCTLCGLWTSEGRTTCAKLGIPCTRTVTGHGKRLLKRLGRIPPMPPYHLTEWPDGTAIAKPSSKRKRPQQPAAQAAVEPQAERPKPVVNAALASMRARVLERLRRADQAV